MIVAALFAQEARADCDSREMASLVSAAETAFTHMDADLFERASTELDRVLACQTEPLTAIQVASFHRVRALAAFFAENEPGSVLSFQAMLATMPGYELPADIAPEGHPLRRSFDQAKLFSAGDTFELPAPADGWVTVDGIRTRTAPAARPFVFQWLGSSGAVRETQYVTVGTPVPTYAVATAPTTPVDLDVGPSTGRSKPRVNTALLGTGLALGAASAGLYGGAFVFRKQYDEAVLAGDEPKIRSQYLATNGSLGGSALFAVVGTTLVLVGVF